MVQATMATLSFMRRILNYDGLAVWGSSEPYPQTRAGRLDHSAAKWQDEVVWFRSVLAQA